MTTYPPVHQATPAAPSGQLANHGNDILPFILEVEAQVRRYALALCRNVGDAEDLYQNAVLRVLEKSHQYVRGTNFRGWMIQITHRIHLDKCRREQRRQRLLSARKPASAPVHQEPVAADQLHAQQIKALIDGLPDISRPAFELLLQGHPYKEIADELGLPVGTVKSRLHVARLSLRKRYEALMVEPA